MRIHIALLLFLLSLSGIMAQEEWTLRGDCLVAKPHSEIPGPLSSRLSVNGSQYIFASGITRYGQVILWGAGMLDMGEEHPLLLLSKSLQVVRKGHVHCWYNEVPLMFIEMKTQGTNLPPSYRNKWIYGVIIFDSTKSIPKNGILKIVPEGRDLPDNQICAEVTPIRWDEDAGKFGMGLGLFSQTDDQVELREIH